MLEAEQLIELWKGNPYEGKCYMRVSDMAEIFKCEREDIEKYSAQLPNNGNYKAYWNSAIGAFAFNDGFSSIGQELCLSKESIIIYLRDKGSLNDEAERTLSESYRIAVFNIS